MGLAQVDAQFRKAMVQDRKESRQHIGRERWDDAELQPSSQQPAAMAREIDQVAGGGQHLLAPARDLDAGFGQCDVARTAFDQVDPKQFSRSRICMESAGWLTVQASAARPKWRCWARACK